MARKPLSDILNGVTQFGRLTFLGEAEPYCWRDKEYRLALCRCECGVLRKVQPSKLRNGQTVSCGCYAAARASVANRTHGMTRSPEYASWTAMKNRCYRPEDVSYQSYGGRGISVCDRWRRSFEAFYADMGPRPKGTSIDRINVDGNYEPSNCRWATPTVQADNRTDNFHITVAGERMNLTEASRRFGITQGSIRNRLRRGMSEDDAALSPRDLSQGSRHKSNNRYVQYNGKRMLMIEVCEAAGVGHSHLGYHLKQGKTADEAVAMILEGHRRRDSGKCINGHPLAGDNLYISPKGKPQCKACRAAARERSRVKRARKREKN